MTHSDSVPFLKLSSVLDEINSSKKDQKSKLLKSFIQQFQTEALKSGKPFSEDLSFHPILRLLLPTYDRKRGPYGIKEYTLSKLYVRILCLNKGTKDYIKLTQYKAPKSNQSSDSGGDFSEVAYSVLKTRCGKGGELTVGDVNRHLDNIAVKHANHDTRGVEGELQQMLTKMSALEQKWLIRILLKSPHMGLGGSHILDAFHPDASDLYDVCHNLEKVCSMLHNPSTRLHEIEVVLFEPFRPMLSQRLDIQAIETDLRARDFYYVEPKFDGERFQLHYRDGKFKYFSRNGHEYTRTYGEDAGSGILTPHIVAQMNPAVTSCILDGEMMCWNKKYGTYTTKGGNIDVKKLRVGNIHQACFCVFDILLYNGTVLSNKPLSERLKVLDTVFTSREGYIVHTNRSIVHARSQVLPALNKAIDDREEGIVVKEPDALYKPNSRKDGWYKIKPEYTEGAMVELDMLIIGGYYGKGSQRGIVSQFLLGLLDRSNDGEPNSKGPRFVSAGKVGIGLSMEELVDLSQKMSPHWNRTRVGQLPDRIEWTREKPDLWIAPEHSYVLQVKATEVVRSDAFKVQYCLRFPRIQAVRYDKTPGDCLTVEEFHGIRTRGQGKLCYESISMGSTLSSLGKLTRSPRKRKEATLGTEYTCNIQEGGVTLRSHLFKGRSLCVMTGGDTARKNTLELAILEHGGKVVQNCGTDTWCCVVTEERNIRVRHIVSGGNYNVVRAAWLERCVARKTLLEWTPDEVLCLVGDALIEMNNKYDPYGDSYTEPLSVERLASLLNRIDQAPILTPREVEELENELYVSANKRPVPTNRNGVSANRSNESTNSSVLSANSNTSASSHGVSSNRDGVSANREGVSANITSVATNSSTVSTNKSAMSTNSNTLSVNIEGVSSNSSTVSANKGAVFRGCLAYFTVSSRLSRIRFRFYGGIICDALSDRVTHVVVGRESEVREMKEMLGRVGEGGEIGKGTGGGGREEGRFEDKRGGGGGGGGREVRERGEKGREGLEEGRMEGRGEGKRDISFVDEKWIEKCIRSGMKEACTYS